MNAFAYLIPRTMLIAIVLCATAIGGDPLAKRLLTEHLEKTTGIVVELGRLRTRASQGKVFINDLAIVDQQQPMKNLFQSDMAYLQVDGRGLAGRQLIIDNARTSQVRLNVSRTGPTRDLQNLTGSKTLEAPPEICFHADLEEVRMAWMDQFDASAVSAVASNAPVKLYQVAAATNQRWNKDFQQQNDQLNKLKVSFASVVDDALTMDDIQRHGIQGPHNPLRNVQEVDSTGGELGKILHELEVLNERQKGLEAQAEVDFEALESAYQHDAQTLSGQSHETATRIHPQTLSRLLLTDLHQQIASDALTWFECFRMSLPGMPHGTAPSNGALTESVAAKVGANAGGRPCGYRGQFVPVAGYHSKPSLVIGNLLFDGSGRFGQQHVNFAGEAKNISDLPGSHEEPVTFKVRAQGLQHFTLNGSLDRRENQVLDKLKINIPSYHLGPQQLGTETEMQVTLGPKTSVHGVVDLEVDGENVSGKMKLEFSNIAMLVEHLHEVAGGKNVQVRLNHALATLQRIESEATVGGTLANPTLEFRSSLGKEIADAIAEIESSTLGNDKYAKKKQVDQFYLAQVTKLKKGITTELRKIKQAISVHDDLANQIRTTDQTAKSRWPNVR